MREGLLQAVTRAMLDRPLAQVEAVGLVAALAAADRHRDGGETCIPDVIEHCAPRARRPPSISA